MNAPYKSLCAAVSVALMLLVPACASETTESMVDAPESLQDGSFAFDAQVLDHGAKLGTRVEWVEAEPGEVQVHLDYMRAEGQAAPRMAELYLEYSENLTFLEAHAGAAALAANKSVIGQARGTNTVRVLIFSAGNADTFDTGRLASLRFAVSGADPVEVRLLTDRQLFAPADANAGLVVSDPQSIAQGE